MLTTATSAHPVVVIGAGPIGLSAAAHLSERGLPFPRDSHRGYRSRPANAAGRRAPPSSEPESLPRCCQTAPQDTMVSPKMSSDQWARRGSNPRPAD